MKITPRLLGLRDAAAYIGVSYNTLLDYVNRGFLTPVNLPARQEDSKGGEEKERRSRLLDVKDLDAFVDQRKRGTEVGTENAVPRGETRRNAVNTRKGSPSYVR